jgi:hypothetical protein
VEEWERGKDFKKRIPICSPYLPIGKYYEFINFSIKIYDK